MHIDDLVKELKEHLDIAPDDDSRDSYLRSFCYSANGYISAQYRYNILDKEVITVNELSQKTRKVYLPEAPVVQDTVTILTPAGDTLSTGFKLLNAVIVFDVDFVLPEDGIYTVNYKTGVEYIPRYFADIEHCVQLAAWLYRVADKGLDGVEQISTGVKESTKMFSGIPRNITAYFEMLQPMRL